VSLCLSRNDRQFGVILLFTARFMVIGLILYEKSNGVPNRAEEPEHEFPAPASKKFGLVLLIQNYLFQ